jgi:hypothetical protein
MITPLQFQVTEAFTVLKLILGLVIVVLAVYGYRRNASRPMLFLGTGIGMMTVVSTMATIIASILLSTGTAGPLSVGVEIIGMCLILYAIVLARRK